MLCVFTRISFEEKMEVVHQFMFENKLGKGLLQRVDHYFTLLWQQFRLFVHESVHCRLPAGLNLVFSECPSKE